MGKRVDRALEAIKAALSEQAEEINQHDGRLDRLESVVEAQARDIATMQADMKSMRNISIRAAIDRGVQSKVVAAAHGLSRGRVTQIAPRKQPPLC
jgi:chromosome segregation ATPase